MLRKLRLFVFIALVCLRLSVAGQSTDLRLNTVVIDAGHGGKDPGTSSGLVLEKDIVLDVALKVGKYINEAHSDVNVIFTRETDRFVPLNQRAEIANKNKADLFISIHVNFYQSPTTYGAETYILGNHRSEDNLKVAQMENSVILLEDDYTTRYEGFDPNSAESYIMFELMQNEFLEQSRYFADQVQNCFQHTAKRRSRGVKQAGFLVLRETVMPSILVELGYLSNGQEKNYLTSNNGKDQLAKAIASAFSSYKQHFDERSTLNAKPGSVNAIIHEDITELPLKERVSTESWYAVQIMASKQPLTQADLMLNDDDFFYELTENGWHKYYIGFTKKYDEALQNQQVIEKKYKGAFLVVFKNGQKEKFVKF